MAEYVLETKDLSITFGGLKAVQKVNMKIRKGQLFGLIGPNGAGKTTLFNLLTGIYKPTSGEFYLNGKNITKMTQDKINHYGIARTFQNIRLFNNMSVVRNVQVGLHNSPEFRCSPVSSMLRLPRHFENERKMRDRAKELLRIFGLEELRNEVACNLPYGKQRKLEIARALATKPCLLLLDEPAAGMNPQETAELMDMILFIRKEFDLTILLIEHDMSLVSGICEELFVLNFGQELTHGPAQQVLSDPEVVKAYLGD